MRRMQPLTIVLLIATILGFVLLAVAFDTAYRGSTIRAPDYKATRLRRYDCGSVLSPRNLENLVSARANVPRRLLVANNLCQSARSKRSKRATSLLIVGAALVVISFSIPAVRRGRRRRRHRPRKNYSV